MAEAAAAPAGKTKLVIRNIGQILSGKIEEPLIDGDCVICEGDRITAIGYEKDLDTDQPTTVVDAKGVNRLYDNRVRKRDLIPLVVAAIITLAIISAVSDPIRTVVRGLLLSLR